MGIQCFTKNSTYIAPQAPYSPDTPPCDFSLFSRLKNTFPGNRFDSVESKQQKLKEILMEISKSEYERSMSFSNYSLSN